jgi:hypothetical protein
MNLGIHEYFVLAISALLLIRPQKMIDRLVDVFRGGPKPPSHQCRQMTRC